jgi:small neutral amino acid transporter SnatA (MarC family)
MTVWAVLAVVLGATNPFRRRSALDVARLRTVGAGALTAAVVLVVCALAGATLRDTLDVSAPNARIAAGLVCAVVGLHAVVARIEVPAPAEVPPMRAEWLSPVAFPVFLRPDLALIAFASETSDLLAVVVAALGAFALTALWWSRTDQGAPTPGERALGAVLGAVLVLAAIRIVLDGVFAL